MEAKIIWEPCNIDQIAYCKDPENYVEIDQETLDVSELFTIMPETTRGPEEGSGNHLPELNSCSPPDDCGIGCATYDFIGTKTGCKCHDNAILENDICVPTPESADRSGMPTCDPVDDCGYGCDHYDMFGLSTGCKCIENSELSNGKCLEPVSIPADPALPICALPDDCGYGCMKYDFIGSPVSCDCIDNSEKSENGKCLKPISAETVVTTQAPSKPGT